MEQKKAVCGGFYIGDGLEMDGKTLYATGGEGSGCVYVTGRSDDKVHLTLDMPISDIVNLIKNGTQVILSISLATGVSLELNLTNRAEQYDMYNFGYYETEILSNSINFIVCTVILMSGSYDFRYQEKTITT